MSKRQRGSTRSAKRKAERQRKMSERTGVVPAKLATDLAVQEANIRRMLMMVVDAVGGRVAVSPRSVARVTTVQLRLRATPIAEADGGGVLIELEDVGNGGAPAMVERPMPAPSAVEALGQSVL